MAAKRQTTYCESWEKEFPFLRGILTDKYRGLCVACNKTFRIDGSGISQVRSHMSGPTHLEHEKRMKNQVTFYRSDNGSTVTSKNKFVLLPYEQIVKAEVFQFDDTTTSHVKKQYDGFVQYWSKSQNLIVVAYCGSLFVDHCPAEKLVEHFFTFILYIQKWS